MARRIARTYLALYLTLTVATVAAAYLNGPVTHHKPMVTCPWPAVVHGVDRDLRTFRRDFDRCSMIT